MLRRLAITIAVLSLVTTGCTDSQFDGTLIAVVDPQGETSGFGDFTTGSDKSFGIFVCAADGAVQLNSIDAESIEGDAELLGGVVYTSPDMFVGAANGFPTDGLDEDRVEPLEGAVVERTCDETPGEDLVQVIVGAERTSSDGGVIDGIEVDTSGGTLVIDYTILLCGDELEFCEFLLEDQ